jgi:hypothetical protein
MPVLFDAAYHRPVIPLGREGFRCLNKNKSFSLNTTIFLERFSREGPSFSLKLVFLVE